MQLTTDQARELIDARLESEGIHDAGSVRLDIAAEHFARDLEAADEREAEDLDRVPAWFLRDPWLALSVACFTIAAIAFVVAWLIH